MLLLIVPVRGASSERLSHPEYLTRAAATCYEMTSSMLGLQTGGKDAVFRRTAAVIRRAVRKLRRLRPSTADERQHDVLTDALADVAQMLDDYPPLNRGHADGRLLIVHRSSHDLGIRSGCGSG
jgi:hypothetical protein